VNRRRFSLPKEFTVLSPRNIFSSDVVRVYGSVTIRVVAGQAVPPASLVPFGSDRAAIAGS